MDGLADAWEPGRSAGNIKPRALERRLSRALPQVLKRRFPEPSEKVRNL